MANTKTNPKKKSDFNYLNIADKIGIMNALRLDLSTVTYIISLDTAFSYKTLRRLVLLLALPVNVLSLVMNMLDKNYVVGFFFALILGCMWGDPKRLKKQMELGFDRARKAHKDYEDIRLICENNHLIPDLSYKKKSLWNRMT